MQLNKIYNIDVLEGLRQLEDESIDLIITSPPYNKAGFNGKKRRTEKCIWNKTIDYSNDPNVDYMDEDDYEQWQIDVLNECYRVLKTDGSIFYNHKIRMKQNQISHPLDWISKSKCNCRQIITWDRTSSPNQDTCRYVPTTELIFWLTKGTKNPRFHRGRDLYFQTDVWRFPAVRGTEHPAPFPIELPDNIIPAVSQGERIIVLDPFMGSGTTAKSAIKWGCDYLGFEIDEYYCQLANTEIKNVLCSHELFSL